MISEKIFNNGIDIWEVAKNLYSTVEMLCENKQMNADGPNDMYEIQNILIFLNELQDFGDDEIPSYKKHTKIILEKSGYKILSKYLKKP